MRHGFRIAGIARIAGVTALVTLLWGSASMAAAIPVQTSPPPSQIELVREERRTSKTATTKAWLRKKKNQTANWVGRQKRKLKELVDLPGYLRVAQG